MKLFKGYIKTKNKRAISKWKNGNLLKLEDVQDNDEYAGILAKNTILLDVDNGTQAKIVAKMIEDLKINCKIIQTTRGKHFYFKNDGNLKNCKTGVNLACGLNADFKVGLANSYAVLKYGGVERSVERECENPDILPYFLRPIPKADVSFIDMKAGDGRNSALFSYILTLTRNGFTKKQSKEIIGMINEYVLEDKLDDDEIASITRDEAFKQPAFYNGSKFLHDRFANFLVGEEHIVKLNGQLHIYCDGAYCASRRKIEASMINHIPAIRDAQRKEVMKYLDVFLENENKLIDARYIAFNNGILDIATNKMFDFSPDRFVTNKIDYNYDPKAYDKLTDTTLNKLACKDKEIRALIEECIGTCMYRRNELGKAFLLVGEASNGKSTLLDMIKTMLGFQNVSALDVQELGDRFNTAMLFNKLANIGDDIPDDFMRGRQISTFKKIVTGNRIKAEQKGQDPFEFEPYVKLLFSANTIPRTKDTTGAVMRRLIIIPFKAKFSSEDKDYDPFIKYKLCEPQAIEYLIKIAIEGLRRVIANKGFTQAKSVKQELKNYELENNPILSFIVEYGKNWFIAREVKEAYITYRAFCENNGFVPVSNISFGKQIRQRLKMESKLRTIDGETRYIYEKK